MKLKALAIIGVVLYCGVVAGFANYINSRLWLRVPLAFATYNGEPAYDAALYRSRSGNYIATLGDHGDFFIGMEALYGPDHAFGVLDSPTQFDRPRQFAQTSDFCISHEIRPASAVMPYVPWDLIDPQLNVKAKAISFRTNDSTRVTLCDSERLLLTGTVAWLLS